MCLLRKTQNVINIKTTLHILFKISKDSNITTKYSTKLVCGEISLVNQKHHDYYLKAISFWNIFPHVRFLKPYTIFYSLNGQKNKYRREQSKIPIKHNVQTLGKRGLAELRKSWDNWATASHWEVFSWHFVFHQFTTAMNDSEESHGCVFVFVFHSNTGKCRARTLPLSDL